MAAAKKALTKSQTMTALAEATGLKKKEIVCVLEELVALAYKEANAGFTIPGLGKLVLVNRKARMGRNPQTGETIQIAASRTVGFKAGKALKQSL